MKIQDIFQSVKSAGKSAGKNTTVDFQQLLAREIGASRSTQPAATAAAPGEAYRVPAALRLQSLELTDTTINTLDALSIALGNTALKTEELEPYVAALEEDVAALLAAKQQMPADDPLAKLLDRVATVSYLETAKYRRGDYS